MRLKLKCIFLIIFLPVIFSTCLTSRYSQEASNITINECILKNESMRIIMKDGREYYIDGSNLGKMSMDSVKLSAPFEFRKQDATQSVKRDIPLDSIELIQISKKDPGKSLIVYGGILTLTTMMILAQDGPDQPEIYTPGSGSCPFVYSWNGDTYVLEGEAIGAGFGKKLELQTSCMLTSLQEQNSKLKLRIMNERPETHYLNSIQLVAIETDKSAVPHFDTFNQIWPVYHPHPVLSATDHSGNNITEQLKYVDENYWDSDLGQTSLFSDFNDQINLVYNIPLSYQEGTLIIHAINTHIANFIFDNIFQFLGDRSLQFIHAVENDPQLSKILREWMIEASLKASIWNGKQWQQIGMIYPEANEVPFTKTIHFTTSHLDCDTIKLRLTCLSDVWKIDAIFLDNTPVKALKGHIIPPISAQMDDQQDVSFKLKSADDTYVTLMPPQYIALEYKAYSGQIDKKVTYGVQVQGYLHEWISRDSHISLFTKMNFVPETLKIDYLTNLLRLENKFIFLPPIYSAWKQNK